MRNCKMRNGKRDVQQEGRRLERQNVPFSSGTIDEGSGSRTVLLCGGMMGAVVVAVVTVLASSMISTSHAFTTTTTRRVADVEGVATRTLGGPFSPPRPFLSLVSNANDIGETVREPSAVAFLPKSTTRSRRTTTRVLVSPRSCRTTTTALYGKKKGGGGAAAAKLAALESLEKLEKAAEEGAAAAIPGLDDADDDLTSKKDAMRAAKKQAKKNNKGKKAAVMEDDFEEPPSFLPGLSDDGGGVVEKKEEDAPIPGLGGGDNGDDEEVDMSHLSKKELRKLQKQGGKSTPMAEMTATDANDVAAGAGEQQQDAVPSLSKKELAALKAIEETERMEAAQREAEQDSDIFGESSKPLSKKEAKLAAKAAAKKEEKLAAKRAKKEAKRKELEGDSQDDKDDQVADNEEEEEEEDGEKDALDIPGVGDEDLDPLLESSPPEVQADEAQGGPKGKLTLEERIRKERPPPRIRVMESSQPNYLAVRLEGVGITFRDQEVLRGVTWGVQTGDRLGLVGPNGSGKTTQLRIMAGEMEPTTGDVVKSSKDLRVTMLRQEFVDELVPERTLKEEFLSVFAEENAILQGLAQAEEALANVDNNDADEMQRILDEMQDLQVQAENKDAYAIESRAQKVMDLMGFEPEEGDYLVAAFSGGWKMRIGLGKVLLTEPNILLLDEPTNHLDLESVEWLEAFLRNQKIPMVIVSHDREFLDQVCTKIVDVEGGMAQEYDGNYSRFLQLKKARLDAWQASYDAQEKKLKEERSWINKFRVKQPQAVKQRQAKLEKFIKSDEYVQKPPFLGKPLKFRFPDAPRLSPEVAEIKGLSHSYGSGANRLFEDAELSIDKNDRIAVIGPNGSGKSTLLRILLGREMPDEGTAQIVGQNVICNYFEQNQADVLDLDLTVLDTVQAASNGQSYNELRALLGQFLFKGDAVEKKVEKLSGGEKARLSLCCMMLRPANLLVLDEPTNHLDIPAKEMLEEALQHFQGSVVIISHDRYFVSKVATTIVAIEEKKLVKYIGDYKNYMDKSKAVKERVEARYVQGNSQRIESAPVVDLEEVDKPRRTNFGGAKNANLVSRKNKGVKNAKRKAEKEM